MAGQFDLYRDPDGELLLILQSDAVDALGTRVFASCVPADRRRTAELERLSIPFIFAETEFRVMLNLLGTARLSTLGKKVGNLSTLRDQITRALDLLVTGV
jgi:toxin CcdB